ncbi:ArsR/SmtB family transcription factor [Singulisphaera sp. PoT]|uniref:ArsR/SmtB family transcription factor n=1 Tax=Singulisphaera sp. PoT TaxID=3411797 RepID=UPI003BF4BFA1
MRPLYHPPLSEITVRGLLHALSDPVRVCIYRRLSGADRVRNCVTFAHVGDKLLPKSSLSQHFKVLREAGLIRSERKGVELHNQSRGDELKEKFGRMIDAILEAYEDEAGASKT